MPNLLACAKYVLHRVAVETLVMVIAIVMIIVLTIIIVIVIIIIIVHGCGDMAIVRYIIGDYKNETMSHWQQL